MGAIRGHGPLLRLGGEALVGAMGAPSSYPRSLPGAPMFAEKLRSYEIKSPDPLVAT